MAITSSRMKNPLNTYTKNTTPEKGQFLLRTPDPPQSPYKNQFFTTPC